MRAGLVRHPADYAWSSYAVNSGLAPTRSSRHMPNSAPSDQRARTLLSRLFEQELSRPFRRDIRHATHGGYPLASDDVQG